MVAKLGLDKAIDITVEVAEHLPNKQNRSLYTKTIHSIFDDQLRLHTTLNRRQRHNARKLLKEAMKKHV